MLCSLGEGKRNRIAEEKQTAKNKNKKKKQKESWRGNSCSLCCPPHVAWQLEGISLSHSLSQQLLKLTTSRIIANGAGFVH